MLRKYAISILTRKNAAQIADNILKDFDCVISEPSTWLSPGTTTESGLTFLEKNGRQLHSALFKNQAYFNSGNVKVQKESETIEALIYNVLFDHYHFESADVKVTVTEYK